MSEKIRTVIRSVFSPGPSTYDQTRQIRVFVLSLVLGIIAAVGFGALLYVLNTSGRLH